MSRHCLGDHAEGRSLIERALIWFEQNRPQSTFRFGLDQHAAGLAFLARVLWVQGYTTDAVKTANLAVERALALDHASTLCCALAEGLCMVSALNQNLDALETAAQTLTRTASQHGLQVWKAYGDLFERYTMLQHKEKPASGRFTSVIRLLDECSSTFGTRPLSLAFFVHAHHQWGRCGLRSVRLWTARTATGRCLSSSVSKRSSIWSTTLDSLNRQLSIAWKARWRSLTNVVPALGN
jgi:hypothetical protein